MGSLKNTAIPPLGVELRNLGHDVFDDWFAPGPDADDHWRAYEKSRGRTYAEALYGKSAKTIFNFDKANLDWCDAGILVAPAGKSAHMELGYLIGQGKLGFVLFDQEPERWDVMYQFASGVYFNKQQLFGVIDEHDGKF